MRESFCLRSLTMLVNTVLSFSRRARHRSKSRLAAQNEHKDSGLRKNETYYLRRLSRYLDSRGGSWRAPDKNRHRSLYRTQTWRFPLRRESVNMYYKSSRAPTLQYTRIVFFGHWCGRVGGSQECDSKGRGTSKMEGEGRNNRPSVS
jgi:hypothetical protein